MRRYVLIALLILICILPIASTSAKFDFIWTGFTTGELSPLIEGQVGFNKYFQGAKVINNFIPRPQGAVSNRSGFKFIGGTKTDNSKSRLIPFIPSDTQAYALEFGDQYIRFFRDGGQIFSLDAETVFMMHANEADATAGASIKDSSATPHTITAVGNAQTDEDQSKFNSNASLKCDGTGDYISIGDSVDFDWGNSKFTLDFWVRFINSGNAGFYEQWVDNDNFVLFQRSSATDLNFIIKDTTSIVVRLDGTGLTLNNDTWYHFAVIRGWGGVTDDWAMTVNGVAVDTTTAAITNPTLASDPWICGTQVTGTPFHTGWIEEFRISKGKARWTENFVPLDVEYGLSSESGGSVLELTTNVDYLQADLFQLQFVQSADTLYISHPSYPPRKLLRFSDTDWRLIDIEFYPPALQTRVETLSAALTLSAATAGDSRTFTPDSDIFVDGDVGREIREKVDKGNGRGLIRVWNDLGTDTVTVDIFVAFSSTSIANGDWEMVGSGQVAILTWSNLLTANTIVPGEVFTITADLDVFLPSDVGNYIEMTNVTTGTETETVLVKIITRSSPTVVIVSTVSLFTVLFTDSIVAADTNWQIKTPMWDSTQGFPRAVTFFENRLLWGGSSSFPQTIWGSEVDDYENHSGGVLDANSYEFTLAGRQVNKIQWMHGANNLLLGTEGAEWILGARGAATAVTPTNVSAKEQTSYGAKNIMPVPIGQTVAFIEKGGRKLRQALYDFDTDSYIAPDLTILAEHITKSGINEIDFMGSPFPIVWLVRGDGILLGFTYNKEQDISAWHRHTIGGTDAKVESIAVIPGTTEDELWAIIGRTIDGGTKRYVERLEPLFDQDALFVADSDTTNDAFFVDSGLSYDGISTTAFSGLGHLEGEILNLLCDGEVIADETVSSGAITTDSACSVLSAGLPITAQLQTMRPEVSGASIGTIQGKKKHISEIVLRLYNAKQFKYGDIVGGTFKEKTLSTLSSGDNLLRFVPGNNRHGYVTIQQEEPLPITVQAIMLELDVNE